MKTPNLLLKCSFLFTALLILNSGCNDPVELPDGTNMGIVKDIDGNEYNTVKIGSQIWLKENLRVTHYNDGTEILNITDSVAWSKLKTAAFCAYRNKPDSALKYGILYNWYAVNTGKLAPDGWRVPTNTDFDTLRFYVAENYFGALEMVGNHLRNTTGWRPYFYFPDNETGFSAVPSGYRVNNGHFDGVGRFCNFWSSNQFDNQILVYSLNFSDGSFNLGISGSNNMGFSIRCLKNK